MTARRSGRRGLDAAMSALELLLRGVAAGAMLATAGGMLRDPRAPGRWAGAAFCASVAAFAVHSEGPDTEALGFLKPLAWFLSAGGIGYFWLFAMSIFSDRRMTPAWLAPVAVLTAVAAVGSSLPRASAQGVWVVHNLLEVVLVAQVLALVWRSRRGDLVEARRSLRTPFLALIAVYAVVLSGFEIAEELGEAWSGASLAQAASLALMGLAGAAVFLRPREGLFDAPHRRPQTAAVDVRDRPALDRLDSLMTTDQLWRREGLTIGALAEAVGVPEHRLRRLINAGLGYRNFADFLSERRIAAAKTALADPGQSRTPISSLAFDLGYASLGPFNRAFKDSTGETPTAWRLRALGSPQP
jgi:AraC-like DNA-binding protein